MQFRVFVTADIGKAALDRLRQEGYRVDVYPEADAPPRSVLRSELRQGVDALITTIRDPVDADLIQQGLPRLKVISQYAVGYDNLDVEAATRLGVPVTNTPDVLSDTTAEFAFFILGALARKLIPSEQLLRGGGWKQWHPYLPFLGDEVTGKTVAVIGCGRIGRLFAERCLAFDMRVLLFSRRQDQDLLDRFRHLIRAREDLGFGSGNAGVQWADFETCLKEADFVSLHLPLTDQTRGMIGETEFRMMKKTAYLINTSRGPVVDETDLCRALVTGEISGAALDVFEKEPLPGNSPLLDERLYDRLRLYHHFGSGGVRTRLSADPDLGMAGRCVQSVINVLRSKGDLSEVPHVVNRDGLSDNTGS